MLKLQMRTTIIGYKTFSENYSEPIILIDNIGSFVYHTRTNKNNETKILFSKKFIFNKFSKNSICRYRGPTISAVYRIGL